MTTSTLPPVRPADNTSALAPTATAAVPPSATGTGSGALDRVPLLALIAPLVLFAHGIVAWVDGLDALDGLNRPGALGDLGGLGGIATAREQGALTVAAGILLVLAVAGFAWLTMLLGPRLRHLTVAAPATLLAAFGAGATAAVWLGHVSGLLGRGLPDALTWGGPVLTALALALVLVALTIEGGLPVGSLALAGLATIVLLLPWGLLPLGSLLLLIALAPLTRAPE